MSHRKKSRASRLETELFRKPSEFVNPWSVKTTYLKSWRDKQTYKSRKRALIRVRSWWTVFICVVNSSFYFCTATSPDYFLISPSHFLHSRALWEILFLLLLASKSSLFNDDDDIFSSTMENQNFPIDKHFHSRKTCFTNFFIYFLPIFLFADNWNFLVFFLLPGWCREGEYDKFFTQYLLLLFCWFYLCC